MGYKIKSQNQNFTPPVLSFISYAPLDHDVVLKFENI